eukprot:scaffold9848_cov75-Skeletonema_dohrnii-CCMP3373.AAC.2
MYDMCRYDLPLLTLSHQLPTSVIYSSSSIFFFSAAYEVPSDNLIAELADEYNEDEFIDKKMTKKEARETSEIIDCIKENTKNNRKWFKSLEKTEKKAESCMENAVDDDAKLECVSPFIDLAAKSCPAANALRGNCDSASLEVEDFAEEPIQRRKPCDLIRKGKNHAKRVVDEARKKRPRTDSSPLPDLTKPLRIVKNVWNSVFGGKRVNGYGLRG